MTASMPSVTVRFVRNGWAVDWSETENGKRKRTVKSFGKGPEAKAQATDYATEVRRQLEKGTFHARRSMTFEMLWRNFLESHLPNVGPSTAADYRALGENYLIPERSHLSPPPQLAADQAPI